MPNEGKKLLEFSTTNLYKVPLLIYAYLESLIKKIDGFKNNPEKLSTTKVGEYILCGCSISTTSAINDIEKKHA